MTTGDASVMSALTPTYKIGVEWPHLKNSPVYHGSHTLRLRQPSKDPAYNRAYASGDPVNLIDWKAFVRTDQLIVRQQRHEASGKVIVALDVAPTMFWPDQGINEALGRHLPSKFQIALRIACHLAYTHLKIGDQVAFILLNEPGAERYQQLRGIRSCQDIVRLFLQAETADFAPQQWHEGLALAPFNPGKCDVLLVISDALEATYADLFAKATGNVRWLLHVLSNLEVDSQWVKGAVSYFEDETNAREFQGVELVNDAVLRTEVQAWLERLDAEAKEKFFSHIMFTDQTALDAYESWLNYATQDVP